MRLFEPCRTGSEIDCEQRNSTRSEDGIQGSGRSGANSEILQSFSRVHRLERSLIEGEPEHNHLILIHLTKRCAHRVVPTVTAHSDMAVVRPYNDFRFRRLVQDPANILCHTLVSRDLVRAHLETLQDN